jgi:D-alanyl-D-alanine endopeptidase (penicillin-binding protein 7)
MDRIISLLALLAVLCNWQTAFANTKHVPITATSWLVTDYKGKIIDGDNWNEVRPIASVTKLMTAMVILDSGQNLDERIKNYTRRELIHLTITHSDNKAAITLCESYPGGKYECVKEMNRKARSFGLSNTRYVEPTGLSVMNVSTADELVTIVLEASRYQEIVNASKSTTTVQNKKRLVSFNNTNPITKKRDDVIVSKTGWIRASGGCLVMLVNTPDGQRVVVVLNSKTIKTRVPDAEHILATY